MKEKVKVAIIGCGAIAQKRHLPEYLANPAVDVVGYFDNNLSRAQALAQQYGGHAYTTLAALLADPQITAVSVCVVNQAHAAVAIQALKAGKHVLCEKPMATSWSDCQRMVQIARQTGKKLLIDHNQRLIPAHQAAYRLLRQGKLGNLLTFKTTFGHSGPETWSVGGKNPWFFDKKLSQSGAIFDLGIHKIDLLRYLLADEIQAVWAQTATLDKRLPAGQLIGVDDNAIGVYQFGSGVRGTVIASWTYYGPQENSTYIYGSQGVMKIQADPQFPLQVIFRNGQHMNYQWPTSKVRSSGVIAEFIQSIQEDRPTILDAAQILGSMQALFASLKSARTGQIVSLNPA